MLEYLGANFMTEVSILTTANGHQTGNKDDSLQRPTTLRQRQAISRQISAVQTTNRLTIAIGRHAELALLTVSSEQ